MPVAQRPSSSARTSPRTSSSTSCATAGVATTRATTSFTQPLMYDLIEQKRSVCKLYTEALIGRGDITLDEAEQALRDYQQQLERVFAETREAEGRPPAQVAVPTYPKPGPRASWSRRSARRRSSGSPTPTSTCPRDSPSTEGAAAAAAPGSDAHRGRHRLGHLPRSPRSVAGARPAADPALGQDTRRGTFVQRFAAIVDRATGEVYVPLQHLDEKQAKFYVYDSLLSEFAAMGFEYGYSVARPDALVLWEAQFGDFANGAQTIIDEFVASENRSGTSGPGRPPASPRLRGPGARPLLRAHRTLPDHGGRRRVPGGPSTCLVLPPVAAADPASRPQAPDRVHAEVHASEQEGGLCARRPHRPHVVPPGDRRRRGGHHPGRVAALFGEGGLGPARRAGQAVGRTRRSCRSSSSIRCRPARSPPSWGGSRGCATCAGSRTSRATWAPGRSCG